MALTSPPDAPSPPDVPPRGLAALKHLVLDDEGGSAAVEFIVLVPVYIVLLAGLFSMGQVMQVRQQVVAAARYEAWNHKPGGSAAGPAAIQKAFFGMNVGTWSSNATEADVPLALGSSAGGGGGGISEQLGQAVLENKVTSSNGTAKHPLRLVKVDADYRWDGLSFLTGRTLSIGTWTAVILTTDHQRPIFDERSGEEHVMVAGRVNGSPLARFQGFDPLGKGSASNPFMNPVFKQFRESSTDPGIWNKDVRITGQPNDIQGEHGKYKQLGGFR